MAATYQIEMTEQQLETIIFGLNWFSSDSTEYEEVRKAEHIAGQLEVVRAAGKAAAKAYIVLKE